MILLLSSMIYLSLLRHYQPQDEITIICL